MTRSISISLNLHYEHKIRLNSLTSLCNSVPHMCAKERQLKGSVIPLNHIIVLYMPVFITPLI